MDVVSTVLAILGTIMVGAYCVMRDLFRQDDNKNIEDEIADRAIEIGKLQDDADKLEFERDITVDITKKIEDLTNSVKYKNSELAKLSDEEVVDTLRDRGF